MYCTKCGMKLMEGAQYCTKCGSKIEYNNMQNQSDIVKQSIENVNNDDADVNNNNEYVEEKTIESTELNDNAKINNIEIADFKSYVDNHIKNKTKYNSADELIYKSKPWLIALIITMSICTFFVILSIKQSVNILGGLFIGALFSYAISFIVESVIRLKEELKYRGKIDIEIDKNEFVYFLNCYLKEISPLFFNCGHLKEHDWLLLSENIVSTEQNDFIGCEFEKYKKGIIGCEFGKHKKGIATIDIYNNTNKDSLDKMYYYIQSEHNGFIILDFSFMQKGASRFLSYGCFIKTAPIIEAALLYFVELKKSGKEITYKSSSNSLNVSTTDIRSNICNGMVNEVHKNVNKKNIMIIGIILAVMIVAIITIAKFAMSINKQADYANNDTNISENNITKYKSDLGVTKTINAIGTSYVTLIDVSYGESLITENNTYIYPDEKDFMFVEIELKIENKGNKELYFYPSLGKIIYDNNYEYDTYDCEYQVTIKPLASSKNTKIFYCIPKNAVNSDKKLVLSFGNGETFTLREKDNTQNNDSNSSRTVNNTLNVEKTTAQNSTVSKDADWKKAYTSQINKISSQNTIQYDLIYIDSDDIPELVIDVKGYQIYVYTYSNGKINELINSPYGAGANTSYKYLTKNSIVCAVSKGDAGATWYNMYYKLSDKHMLENLYDGEIVMRLWDDKNNNGRFDSNEYSGGTSHYYYNNKEITSEEYEKLEIPGDYKWIGGNITKEEILLKLK